MHGAVTAVCQSYNDAGCVTYLTRNTKTNINSLSLSWNGEYQLTQVEVVDPGYNYNYVYYTYDSLGRKTSRTDNDTCEYYIYDGMNLVADYDAYNGRITRTYSYGPGVDNIQSMTIYDEYGSSETYYYIKDASNTVHVLVDEDGLIVEYYYYDAFGNVKMRDENYQWMTESNYGNRFLFQGREYDYDAALYYFRNRWYEPETGRWLSPDPIGISGGLNLYAFCGNDPVNFVDPSGLARLKNGTGRPVLVSGNLGDNRGTGPQYYAVIPPNQDGEDVCWGGENSLDGYKTARDAINAYLHKPEACFGKIKDIDFFYQLEVKILPENMFFNEEERVKLVGDDTGMAKGIGVHILKQDNDGNVKLHWWSNACNNVLIKMTPLYEKYFKK